MSQWYLGKSAAIRRSRERTRHRRAGCGDRKSDLRDGRRQTDRPGGLVGDWRGARTRGLTMAKAETRVLTAHVPVPLAEKVDQLAARLERSRGWVMKQALSSWVAQEEERDRLTHEALADVDAGRVIDHQAVQAWADSLGTDGPLPLPRGWK